MTSRLRIAAALALSLGATPALAEPPYPTVDFQGEWVLSDDNGNLINAEMHYSAANKKMRIDMSQQGMEMTSVRDMESGEMIMWSSQMPGMAMRLPTMDINDFDGERSDEVRTIGSETCTVWTMKDVQACLTEENIPVETSGAGYSASLQNIQRTDQDVSLFAVPDGVTVMDMPANMPGGGMGAGGMGAGQGLPF
jgi:hypothetical protein